MTTATRVRFTEAQQRAVAEALAAWEAEFLDVWCAPPDNSLRAYPAGRLEGLRDAKRVLRTLGAIS